MCSAASDHSILWRNFYPRLALLVFGSETSRICSNFAKQSEINWSPFLVFLCGFDHFPAPREFDSCLRPSFSLPFEHPRLTYPLFTNYAYRLHNYVQKFLPWERRLEAGVLFTISSPLSLRGSLRLCSFFLLGWLERQSYAGYVGNGMEILWLLT